MASVTTSDFRNIQAELLLNELGLDWELRMVPMDQIDTAASRANQARFEAISPELLARYDADYKAGAKFPAVLCGANSTAGLIIADGNHRHDIFIKNGQAEIPGYVFKYDDAEAFRAVADLANVRLNGLGNSLEERLEHATRACERTDITIAQAAQLFGISRTTLKNYRRAREIKLMLKDDLAIGPRYWKHLSDNILSELGGILVDNAWLPALTTIAGGVAGTALRDAVRPTSDIPTTKKREEAQIQIILRLAEDQRSAKKLLSKKGTSARDPVAIATMQLQGAHKVISKTLSHPTPEQKVILESIRALFLQ